MKNNNAITVHIYYTGENGSAKAFVKEMLTSGLVDEIRKEKGNRHYASSIMDKIMELRIKYHLHMKVERYFLDETGIPEEDQKFIKK